MLGHFYKSATVKVRDVLDRRNFGHELSTRI